MSRPVGHAEGRERNAPADRLALAATRAADNLDAFRTQRPGWFTVGDEQYLLELAIELRAYARIVAVAAADRQRIVRDWIGYADEAIASLRGDIEEAAL